MSVLTIKEEERRECLMWVKDCTLPKALPSVNLGVMRAQVKFDKAVTPGDAFCQNRQDSARLPLLALTLPVRPG